jgi:hypothetical protein
VRLLIRVLLACLAVATAPVWVPPLLLVAFVVFCLDPAFTHPSPAAAAMGRQNQLAAEQNRVLGEIASALGGGPEARVAPPVAPRPAPPAWAGKGIAGYLDSLR